MPAVRTLVSGWRALAAWRARSCGPWPGAVGIPGGVAMRLL